MGADQTLGERGENAALASIIPLLPPAPVALLGPGDDSAVLSAPDGRMVISSDMMIEGPDFRLDWSSPRQVGIKAIASNSADIAAMGATPVAFQLSVGAPASLAVSVLEDLARGCAEGIALLAPGAGVTGGDLSHAPVLTIAVTVLGDLAGATAVTRSGARPGDVVAVAGELGLSARGLRLLRDAGDDATEIARLVTNDPSVSHHLAPLPPIALGVVANAHGATAMMDISDGLVLDATRMARASGVTVVLDPLYPWDGDALTGGEDHGLLATFPASATVPEGFVVVGVIEEAHGEPRVSLAGVELAGSQGGWDPFYDFSAK
jgi:thiamine-monophosphate kinase